MTEEKLVPCARCGMRAAVGDSPLCAPCLAHGPLTPEEAARWRSRLLEDGAAADLIEGEEYDVRTTDGTVYENAVFVGLDSGILYFDVFSGLARVGVADHEFAGVE